MNFLDEHIEWMQDLGLPILERSEVRLFPAIQQDLPDELSLWFEHAMHARSLPFQALGFMAQDGGWLHPSIDESIYVANPEYHATATEKGLFPRRPVGLATYWQDNITVETSGERAGWLYGNDWIEPCNWGGPICTSLSEWFKAVRTLTEAGVLDPTSDTGLGRHKAPIDTPSWLVKPIALTKPVGRDDALDDEAPMAGSIRDLLPDFEFLHPLLPNEANYF